MKSGECFFVQKIYVFFFILHKHHSEEMFWICLNVRIQKWSNCCALQLWRKFSSNFCFVIKIQFNALFANAGSFFCCWICVSTLFNKNQMLTKVWLSKWFMNVQHLDRVKPHLCSSSQNIKNTFNGFVLQQYMPETIA